MRSKVAEETRNAQRLRILAMTPSERIAEVSRLSERGVELFMVGQQVSRDEAIRLIRRSRQTGRRPSRCMED